MVPGVGQMRSSRSEAGPNDVPPADQVPRLRGILHATTFPLAIAAGIVLIVLAPTPLARFAAAVYAFTSALLFGVSAAYHRRICAGQARDVLHRLDHADIYLIIAGTYTPLTLLALHGDTRVVVLAVIWPAQPPEPRSGSRGPARRAGCNRPVRHAGLDGGVRAAATAARGRSRRPDSRAIRGNPVQPGRAGLRHRATRPVSSLVRLPRGIPRLHGRRLRAAIRGRLARHLPRHLTPSALRGAHRRHAPGERCRRL